MGLWDDGQHDVGGLSGAVHDLLRGDDAGGFEADVVRASVEIAQVIGEIAAGDLDADAMAFEEGVRCRPPEFDGVFIDLVGLDEAEFGGIEGTVSFRIAMSRAHHAFTKHGGEAIGLHVDQAHHPVRVAGGGGGAEFGGDGAGDFDFFFQRWSCIDEHIVTAG